MAVLLTAGRAAPVSAWGFAVHRFVTERAVERLPDPLNEFFRAHRGFVAEHSIDPDLWRRAGFDEEPPRHFLALDAYGAPPFRELPRDQATAIRKFGAGTVTKNGTLPWRTAEIFRSLTEAFTAAATGTGALAVTDVTFYAAVLSHYVADAHVPFHAVVNFDGQLTGQRGIHARFETELFLRYRGRLQVAPAPLARVTDPVDFVFDTLLVSFDLADPLFRADRAARAGRDAYDDRYFEAFFDAVRPTLERRIGDAAGAVTSLLVAAWDAAGRPALGTGSAR